MRATSSLPSITPALHSLQPTSRRIALLVISTLATLSPGSAHASVWGEENAPLYTLVTQGIEELAQGLETVAQLKATYDETKKYVGYVEDGIRAFEDFKSFGEDVLARPQALAEQLFPDLPYYRDLPSRTGAWAQGTGELQRRVRQCLGSGGARGCAEYREAVSVQQARAALEGTFGTTALKVPEVNAVDYEASVALSSASALVGRGAVTREQAKRLLQQCTRGDTDGAIVACQAAAHAAGILQLNQLTLMADALAEANRLQGVALAQANAAYKRELDEAEARRAALVEGARRLAPPRVTVRTDGPELFSGGPY